MGSQHETIAMIAADEKSSPPMPTHASSVRAQANSLGILSFLVVTLGLATAVIHLSLISAEYKKGATGYGTLFILTAVGYLLALAVMYIPVPAFEPFRVPARLLLIGIAVAAIIAYLVLGFFDSLGWVTKAIEVALVVCALTEAAKLRSKTT